MVKASDIVEAKINKKVEELTQRIAEIQLENETQSDLLTHQQGLINSQNVEI